MKILSMVNLFSRNQNIPKSLYFSLVERKSRYKVMIKNHSRHSRPIMDKIIETFSFAILCTPELHL